jgi:thioredoxin-like negative regulator of GroEL
VIEDVKSHFTGQPGDSLQDGRAGRRPGNAENDVALLSKEISNTFREAIFALMQLYESIYDHALKTVREIDALMGENRKAKDRNFTEKMELFTRIEKALDSLVASGGFELKAAEARSETAHQGIFLQKRREIFDHLFALMQKDRRVWIRRSRETRRSADGARYRDPERRRESDRRAAPDRRRALCLYA